MKKSSEVIQAVLQEMKSIRKAVIKQVAEPSKKCQSNPTPNEPWVSTLDVQQVLRICEKTLYRHRRSGKLPYSRIRGKIYYKMSDVQALLNNNYRLEKPKCQCWCK